MKVEITHAAARFLRALAPGVANEAARLAHTDEFMRLDAVNTPAVFTGPDGEPHTVEMRTDGGVVLDGIHRTKNRDPEGYELGKYGLKEVMKRMYGPDETTKK